MMGASVHKILCLFSLTMFCAFGKASDIVLTVEVVGAEPDSGQILLSLFASEEVYLKEPTSEAIIPVDGKGEIVWEFRNLKGGTFAVSAIYDENENGELDTGIMGIPTEPVGISNDAKGFFGPPSFKKASFDLKESKKIVIRLGSAK